MKERRKGQRRKAQRRVDVESAKRYLGMERRLTDRRAEERRDELAAAG
jgi:hypothetical protein